MRRIPRGVIVLLLVGVAAVLVPAPEESDPNTAVEPPLAAHDYAATCRRLGATGYAADCLGRAIEGSGFVTGLSDGRLRVQLGVEGEAVMPTGAQAFDLLLASSGPEGIELYAELAWDGRLGRPQAEVPEVHAARVHEILRPAEVVLAASCGLTWSACADTTEIVQYWQGMAMAQARCRREAAAEARHGAPRFPSPAFIRYRVDEAQAIDGVLVLVEKDAHYQVGTGGWERVTVVCRYDLMAEAVESIALSRSEHPD